MATNVLHDLRPSAHGGKRRERLIMENTPTAAPHRFLVDVLWNAQCSNDVNPQPSFAPAPVIQGARARVLAARLELEQPTKGSWGTPFHPRSVLAACSKCCPGRHRGSNSDLWLMFLPPVALARENASSEGKPRWVPETEENRARGGAIGLGTGTAPHGLRFLYTRHSSMAELPTIYNGEPQSLGLTEPAMRTNLPLPSSRAR